MNKWYYNNTEYSWVPEDTHNPGQDSESSINMGGTRLPIWLPPDMTVRLQQYCIVFKERYLHVYRKVRMYE